MSTPPDAAAPRGFWACRALRPDGSAAWVALVGSDRHRDSELVELPVPEASAYAGSATLAIAHLDPGGAVVGIRVSAPAAPKAPPLWFSERQETGSTPPAVNLVAFEGHDVEPGRLLDRAALAAAGVTMRDQVGAIRIYPATGEVDQLYVPPAWRRRTIGTALTFAAGALTYARGWALPWSDGQRTADGDRLREASVWRHRAADLTNLSPPMTPPEERPR